MNYDLSMKNDLKLIQVTFEQLRLSEDYSEVLTFCDELSRSEFIDYHYSLLKEKNISDEMYRQLRIEFSNHGDGQYFLLNKIAKEKDEHLKGEILRILGSYKYGGKVFLDKTAEYARTFIKSKNTFLRFNGIIVLGWIGNESDVEILANSMFNDEDEQNRGWGATGMMQLFFHKPDHTCPK
jgi:hypothetical protein